MLMSAAARMCIRRRVSVCVNTQQIWLQEINFLAMICVGASVWYSSRSLIHSLTRFPFTVPHEIVSISLLFHSTFTFIWNLTSHSNRAINTLMIAPLLVVQIFHFFFCCFCFRNLQCADGNTRKATAYYSACLTCWSHSNTVKSEECVFLFFFQMLRFHYSKM